MIKMSKLADYAFIILTHMASREHRAWSATDLAEGTTLPLPTVAKIMKLLAKDELVQAQRGSMGGYTLSHPANTVSVTRVIEAVDGPIAVTECIDDNDPDCAVQSICPMHGGWDKVNQAIRGALEKVTLADMMHAPRPSIASVA